MVRTAARWPYLLTRRPGILAVEAAESLYRRLPAFRNARIGGPVRSVLRHSLLRSGLFDAYAYSSTSCSVGLSEVQLADQYIRYPEEPGNPQPRFEADRYRTLAGLPPRSTPLIHFAVHHRKYPTGLAGGFDVREYVRDNPDLRVAGADPLRHYVARGWAEGRVGAPHDGNPVEPSFDHLPGRKDAPQRAGSVDVIVPVHGARQETLCCLHSVLAAKTEIPYRLIVIDDASPDHDLVEALRRLDRSGHVHAVFNDRNLGFTATANRGIAMSADRDVVLLNSDTEVYDGWLDRLQAAAYSADHVATVTPLSNAATILSYPVHLRDNPWPLEISYADLAALTLGLGMRPAEIPTGIGFCLYVRRACLAEIGALDANAFPSGYGEENDFCLRAEARGWRHLAALDCFVRHAGSKSFGDRRAALVAAGLRVVERRYPGYRMRIHRFTVSDPLGPARRQIDIARLRRHGSPLRLVHGRAGAPGRRDLILRKVPGSRDRFLLSAPWCPNTPNLPELDPRKSPEQVAELLGQIGVTEIDFSEPELAGRGAVVAFNEIARSAGIRFRTESAGINHGRVSSQTRGAE